MSTKVVPLAAIIVVVISLLSLCASYISMTYFPVKLGTVKWIDVSEANEKSRKFNKPIVYFFTASWCAPCKLMKKEAFMDNEIGRYMNENFVPVKVLANSRHKENIPEDVKKLQKKFEIEAFPTLVVVSPSKTDTRVMEGYGGKKSVKEFLRESFVWAMEPQFKTGIKWLPLDDENAGDDTKPSLILFWDSEKDLTVYKYISDQELIDLINENFDAYLIPKTPEEGTSKKVREDCSKSINDFGIEYFPSIVVMTDEKSIPHYLLDLSDQDKIYEFLALILQYLPEKPEKK